MRPARLSEYLLGVGKVKEVVLKIKVPLDDYCYMLLASRARGCSVEGVALYVIREWRAHYEAFIESLEEKQGSEEEAETKE